MKLLLDASLPAPRVAWNRHGNSVHRWDEGDVTDAELLNVASNRGYGAVIFLGPQALARKELKEASRKRRIAVVATASEVPTDAARHVDNHVDSIVAKAAPGALLLLRSDGVKKLAWPRLDASKNSS
jgi:hypothetical protein